MTNETAMTRLCSFVTRRRKELKLSQVEFANLVGMTQSWVARFELDKFQAINPKTISLLETGLGLSENYLYLVMGGFDSAADLFISREIHPILFLIAEARVGPVSIQQIKYLLELQKSLKPLGSELTPTMITDLVK